MDSLNNINVRSLYRLYAKFRLCMDSLNNYVYEL